MTPRNVIRSGAAQTIGAETTDSLVSQDGFQLKNRVRTSIAIKCSGVTAADGISLSLWTGSITSAGAVVYRASADKSVSVTTNGVVEINFNPEDDTDVTKLPLGSKAKITATTGTGDAVTVDSIWVNEPPAEYV